MEEGRDAMQNDPPFVLRHLPRELWCEILFYFTPNEWLKASQTCCFFASDAWWQSFFSFRFRDYAPDENDWNEAKELLDKCLLQPYRLQRSPNFTPTNPSALLSVASLSLEDSCRYFRQLRSAWRSQLKLYKFLFFALHKGLYYSDTFRSALTPEDHQLLSLRQQLRARYPVMFHSLERWQYGLSCLPELRFGLLFRYWPCYYEENDLTFRFCWPKADGRIHVSYFDEDPRKSAERANSWTATTVEECMDKVKEDAEAWISRMHQKGITVNMWKLHELAAQEALRRCCYLALSQLIPAFAAQSFNQSFVRGSYAMSNETNQKLRDLLDFFRATKEEEETSPYGNILEERKCNNLTTTLLSSPQPVQYTFQMPSPHEEDEAVVKARHDKELRCQQHQLQKELLRPRSSKAVLPALERCLRRFLALMLLEEAMRDADNWPTKEWNVVDNVFNSPEQKQKRCRWMFLPYFVHPSVVTPRTAHFAIWPMAYLQKALLAARPLAILILFACLQRLPAASSVLSPSMSALLQDSNLVVERQLRELAVYGIPQEKVKRVVEILGFSLSPLHMT